MIGPRAVVAALLLAASFVCAAQARANPDGDIGERVSSAGGGAHLGRELCGFTEPGVAHYKASLRRLLGSPADFDNEWDYGWKRAERTILQFQSLRASDPEDYETRVRRICSTLRRNGERVEKSAASAPK